MSDSPHTSSIERTTQLLALHIEVLPININCMPMQTYSNNLNLRIPTASECNQCIGYFVKSDKF